MSTNTERDELAELLANTRYPNLVPAWPERADRSPVKFLSRKEADAILSAGYRRPTAAEAVSATTTIGRRITKTDELRTLKPGTRLLGRQYKVGCPRLWRVEQFGLVNIEAPIDGICGFGHFKDPLPAIVLTEPEIAE